MRAARASCQLAFGGIAIRPGVPGRELGVFNHDRRDADAHPRPERRIGGTAATMLAATTSLAQSFRRRHDQRDAQRTDPADDRPRPRQVLSAARPLDATQRTLCEMHEFPLPCPREPKS